ncbi:MAG: hypothetical protein ABIZ07_04950 [Dermatophilaceae bacterium]
MGEKGNDPGQLAAATVASALEPSVIERVTTTTTATLVSSGGDVVDKVRDKAVEHSADAIFDGARDRIKGKPSATEASAETPAATSTQVEDAKGESDDVTGNADGDPSRG